mmetsp:Transcript_8236/g.30428  ORF Transcript_8236/g.30428 Transcript_8236/m.30428 type:complete len:297 (+) Transcript_8236:3-893(+)
MSSSSRLVHKFASFPFSAAASSPPQPSPQSHTRKLLDAVLYLHDIDACFELMETGPEQILQEFIKDFDNHLDGQSPMDSILEMCSSEGDDTSTEAPFLLNCIEAQLWAIASYLSQDDEYLSEALELHQKNYLALFLRLRLSMIGKDQEVYEMTRSMLGDFELPDDEMDKEEPENDSILKSPTKGLFEAVPESIRYWLLYRMAALILQRGHEAVHKESQWPQFMQPQVSFENFFENAGALIHEANALKLRTAYVEHDQEMEDFVKENLKMIGKLVKEGEQVCGPHCGHHHHGSNCKH